MEIADEKGPIEVPRVYFCEYSAVLTYQQSMEEEQEKEYSAHKPTLFFSHCKYAESSSDVPSFFAVNISYFAHICIFFVLLFALSLSTYSFPHSRNAAAVQQLLISPRLEVPLISEGKQLPVAFAVAIGNEKRVASIRENFQQAVYFLLSVAVF